MKYVIFREAGHSSWVAGLYDSFKEALDAYLLIQKPFDDVEGGGT